MSIEAKNQMESTMKNIHYQSYDDWIRNFALNLENIWDGYSAKKLSSFNSSQNENSSLVIGRGPSLKKQKHLELLANSNYRGNIVCTDGGLVTALEMGITPDKFPKFHVVTIEPYSRVEKLYNNPIVEQYGSKIKAILPTIASPTVVERIKNSGIAIFWLHLLFDYNEGKKSFNHISSQMVRSKNHLNGLPAIQTGGNAGTASWFVSWQILKCSTVGLIGINHGWEEDDPWEKIISHGFENPEKLIDKDESALNKLIQKIYNPEFECYCYLDPIYQFYSTTLKEFISRSPSWVNTINATEGGSIFGDRIQCMTLKKFLEKHPY